MTKKRFTKNFSEASVNQPVYTLYDQDGKEVGTTNTLPEGVSAGQPVYRAPNGELKAEPDAKVKLDEKTGKITVEAPSLALKNEKFKANITETMKILSHNFKENKNFKYSVVNENGENEEKSIQDILNDINKPAKNEDGTINQDSLQYMAKAAESIERQKSAHARNKVELSDDDVIRINTVAIGPDVKNNTLQLISDLPEAAWLRNIGTYDKSTGFAQYGDIMENAYNKEKVSSEDMIKLWAALEDYFAKGDFSDKDQYIKNVATARFLDATQPNMSWIRDVTENVVGFLNGIGGFSTNLGTAGWVAVEKLGESVVGLIDSNYDPDKTRQYYGDDYSNLYIRRGGNQFATDMPLEKVDAKIGRVRFDADGVPSYVEESISGSFESPKTEAEMIRAVFKENQAVIRKDMEYLHASESSWDMVGYAITNLATLISAGNALSDIFTLGAGLAATKVTAGLAESASAIGDVATSLYASGTALGFGSTAAEAAQIVSGIKTIYDIASATGQAATFLNFVGQAVASAKSTELIIGVVGESLAEAVVGDPDRFVEVLANNEIDDDTKNYLIETYVGNALGWGVGFGVGKVLMHAGESVKGRAISANLSRHLFKVQNNVGDAFDRALLTVRRVKGDTLADKIASLYEKGGKFSQKQANSLASNAILREMRSIISESDSIEVLGKSSDEIEKSLKELETKILDLKQAENALTSMQRQGMDIVQGWLKDNGRGIKEVSENFYKKASSVAELERKSGDLFKSAKGAITDATSGKVLHLFSQTTTNYIKASEKIDFINAYIRKYEHAKGVTEQIVKNIEDYKKELPELQGMVKTFLDNASSELKMAANNFIDADRKWWAKFESLRADLGLTDINELKWYRGSNLWGSNGELYARTTRKSDLSEYVVKHRDGASNVKTYDSYEQYMAGATGDFADPMGEMQLALYDAGNKQAYRSFAKSYDKLTGALTVEVAGEDTALFQRMKKGLLSTYFDSSEQFMKGMVEDIKKSGGVEDVISNLKLKNEQYGDMVKAKASMNTTAAKLQGEMNTVNSENAAQFIPYLDADQTADLWDKYYDVSVRELLSYGEDVPSNTKKYIFSQAKSLGLDVPKDARTVDVYDAVNKSLNYEHNLEDGPDGLFENTIKRSIIKQNDDVLNDTVLQGQLSELRKMGYEAKLETTLAERTWEYEQIAEEYGITVASLDYASREVVEGYISDMTRAGSMQREAIDELCRYYGLEGDPNAIRYYALSAFMDNKKEYNTKLYDQILAEVEKQHPNFSGKRQKKIAHTLADGITKGMEEDFNDAFLIVKEINPSAVHNQEEKIFDEIKAIADKLENAEANRYAGEKNIIAMRNPQGKVEYYKTDPLLARLTNFQYTPNRLNGLTQAIYNTNYLWAKLFRLGTTAINLKSMINQSFRDPINMFVGGGAYRTTQRCMDDIVDVAGDDVVSWLKSYEPEALSRLQRTASETGEDIRKLAVEREFTLGRSMAPGATETGMYKSLSTAKKARLNGVTDIYDDTAGDKFVRGLDKIGDTLGKGNEWRETTLRNLSYQNGLSTALKRGYSLDQARTFATFVMNEATTNFSRMTGHLVSIKDTVPYFGSAINGTKSFFKLLSMDPVGVTGRLVGGLIIPAMALTTYSLMDEENKKVYKNIPEYQKEDSLVFVVGGQVFSIPIPQELGAFIAPFRQAVEGMNGATTNTFAQFAWNDILGFSPLELSGFADLDFAKLEQSSPGFFDRINRGISKLWAQIAPAPLKSGFEIVTGIDPYTGKAIDKSYLDYDEDGNPIVKDYQSGEVSKLLNNMFRSWGLSSSAPVVQNILSNIVGQGSVDILDFLVSLGTQVPNGGWAFSATEQQLSRGEGYNPFYVLGSRITDPVTIEAYNEAQSAWKTEVAKLYEMKKEILRSDAWNEYLEAKRNADDPEKLKNINASKKDLVENYFNTVKNVANNLQKNYGEEFTAAKYATVLSLMTMEEQTLDAGAYGKYLNSEEYKTARAQAIQTMINLGFPSSSSMDILGKFTTSQSGDIYVKTNSPLAILQLDDASGAKLSTQSSKQHYAVVRNLINDAGLYDSRSDYQKSITAAFKKKNYKEAERLANEYNEKLIRAVGEYIKQYTPESVLTGDALDYIKEYVIVPSSYQIDKYGRYARALGHGAYKSEAFKEPYVKYIFNYGKNKLGK